MNRRRGVTSDGRRRVEAELEARGLLPIQGQWEVPSVADLLAGEPVTTRGYSWDYVPAWDLSDALAARDDITIVKLFRARNTLAHAASWSPVEALSRAAAEALAADASSAEHRAALHLICGQPGIPGSALKQAMGWKGRAGSRRFQRVKPTSRSGARWCPVSAAASTTTPTTGLGILGRPARSPRRSPDRQCRMPRPLPPRFSTVPSDKCLRRARWLGCCPCCAYCAARSCPYRVRRPYIKAARQRLGLSMPRAVPMTESLPGGAARR